METRFNRNVLCLTVGTTPTDEDVLLATVVQPKCALPDRCDAFASRFEFISSVLFNRNVLCLTVATGEARAKCKLDHRVQPKCALPDRCDGASIKYVGHRLSCLCLRAPLQLAGLPKRV